MTPLIHNYTKKAGKSFLWDTSDSAENFNANLKNPETKKRLEELGFIDNPISYQFNSHGFRTVEFDQQFDVVCFGCSFTMGTGVHEPSTWPAQLQALTGLKTANLGHAGSSNDTAFRFANHYLKFLRPKYAIWLQTDMHRIELIDDANQLAYNLLASDASSSFNKDFFVKTWFASETNHRLNKEKNTLAFQQVCQNLDIKSIILSRTQVPMHGLFPFSSARDLTHPGPKDYSKIAQTMSDLLDSSKSNLYIDQEPTKL
jgi:hypothetical protein